MQATAGSDGAITYACIGSSAILESENPNNSNTGWPWALDGHWGYTSDLFTQTANAAPPPSSAISADNTRLISLLTSADGKALPPGIIQFNGFNYLAFCTNSANGEGFSLCICPGVYGNGFGNPVFLGGQQVGSSLSLAANGTTSLNALYIDGGTLMLASSTDGLTFTATSLGQSTQAVQAALGVFGGNLYVAYTQPPATVSTSSPA